MNAAAPSTAPPSVPVPPRMTISRASPDVFQNKASGVIDPLNCAYSDPDRPARVPPRTKARSL